MSSLIKSVALLGAALLSLLCIAGLGGFLLEGGARYAALGAGLAASLVTAGLLAGSVLVLSRERGRLRGQPDRFWELTQLRRERALDLPNGFRGGPFQRALSRAIQGHRFMPGDIVEVKPLAEILATLDAHGALEGMPFQPEMIRFCGQKVRVFRSLDKIYDYGRTRLMRRVSNSVLLSNLRCDGSAHGGCQAACYLIWRVEWLRHATHSSIEVPAAQAVAETHVPPALANGVTRDGVHRCQFTDLHGCSREFGWQAWRKDLVPLISGNYSLPAWLVALFTRWFNDFQRFRGGEKFPAMPGTGAHQSPPGPALSPGDRVVVRSVGEIAQTLNRNNKNRGLWFDSDMIKHCGREYRVESRIERIIDDATGKMRQMKSPCITLEGVDYSGEGLHFNAQHDPTFWRDSWLKPVGDDSALQHDAPAAAGIPEQGVDQGDTRT